MSEYQYNSGMFAQGAGDPPPAEGDPPPDNGDEMPGDPPPAEGDPPPDTEAPTSGGRGGEGDPPPFP